MARSPLRRISTLATVFGFLPLVTSGIVMLLTPGGGQRGFGKTAVFLGISRHDWWELHEVAAIVFIIAAAIHVACNWRALVRHFGLRGPTRRSAKDDPETR
ncbi:MAG: DUF4405 domain-containing protein [Rhodospirillales bacterium]|nr:DUF4405 domain-containing protein [Rhodospirillales bacterium]